MQRFEHSACHRPAALDAFSGGGGCRRCTLEPWTDSRFTKTSSVRVRRFATDWPGHFPHGPETVAALVSAGADVNARFHGGHTETPLHWAASSNDVAVLDALLDAGADIDAPGAVIGGGTPLADARAFAQWRAAHRLVERGAQTSLVDAATLGLQDRLELSFSTSMPSQADLNHAFWGACHGGQQTCAEYLLGHGAEVNWIPPWEDLTPMDAARRSDATTLVTWLRERGGLSAPELPARHNLGSGNEPPRS